MNRRSRFATLTRACVVGLFAIPWVIVPLWMVAVNASKTPGEAAELSLGLPTQWALAENLTAVFVQGNYLRALANSLLVSVPTIIVVIIVGAAAAWGFGRSSSKGMQAAFYLIAISMLMPPTLIPTIFLLLSTSAEF